MNTNPEQSWFNPKGAHNSSETNTGLDVLKMLAVVLKLAKSQPDLAQDIGENNYFVTLLYRQETNGSQYLNAVQWLHQTYAAAIKAENGADKDDEPPQTTILPNTEQPTLCELQAIIEWYSSEKSSYAAVQPAGTPHGQCFNALLLNPELDPSAAEINKSARTLLSKLHPDKWHHLLAQSPDANETLNQFVREILEARRVLVDFTNNRKRNSGQERASYPWEKPYDPHASYAHVYRYRSHTTRENIRSPQEQMERNRRIDQLALVIKGVIRDALYAELQKYYKKNPEIPNKKTSHYYISELLEALEKLRASKSDHVSVLFNFDDHSSWNQQSNRSLPRWVIEKALGEALANHEFAQYFYWSRSSYQDLTITIFAKLKL